VLACSTIDDSVDDMILRVSRVTTSGKAYALLEVEDNGAGMSEEVRQRLFEPFFTTKGGAGTGLGLASSRELVTAAGGRVTAASALGVGSTLSVHWPLAAAVASVERSSLAVAIDGSGVNVLVVDDDAQVRSLVVRGLKQFGFAVVEAPDGREGLLVARRHREPLHILCTDCIMPGIPLRDLVAGFRSSHPAGRVVVCSGNAPEESGFEPGTAEAFMAKPFRIKELAQRLHDLVQYGTMRSSVCRLNRASSVSASTPSEARYHCVTPSSIG
jgi:two-component system cell cycle sensor histidine kinase/response regulator CckA